MCRIYFFPFTKRHLPVTLSLFLKTQRRFCVLFCGSYRDCRQLQRKGEATHTGEEMEENSNVLCLPCKLAIGQFPKKYYVYKIKYFLDNGFQGTLMIYLWRKSQSPQNKPLESEVPHIPASPLHCFSTPISPSSWHNLPSALLCAWSHCLFFIPGSPFRLSDPSRSGHILPITPEWSA